MATLAEWIVSSQGYSESAQVTWVDENNNRIRITELFTKGATEERDVAAQRLLEEGCPPIDAKGVQDLGKPHWWRRQEERAHEPF